LAQQAYPSIDSQDYERVGGEQGEKKGDQKYFFVAKAAIVGPKIIATAIIAAAVTIPSLLKAKAPNAHFAIAKAMTVKIIAMIKAKKLIASSLNVETAFFSAILSHDSTFLL
jgi:hypothetical protein